MRKKRLYRSFLLLISLSSFALAAYEQTGEQRHGRQPSHLYQVSMRDAKSGAEGIGFIDKTGKLVIGLDQLPKGTKAVGEFHEGRAVIYLPKEAGDEEINADHKAGYIDETGKVVIAPRYELARDFSEGLAYVEAKEFRGFIDREGKAVINIGPLADDLDEGTGGIQAKDFHEGLAAVRAHGEWGYIDRSGKLVIKRQYRFADDFSEGLAGVEVDSKYGFINQKGEMVIQPRFEPRKDRQHGRLTVGTSRFSEGLACVKLDSFYGFINKKGEFQIQPQFIRAQDFSEGLAWVVVRDEKSFAVQKIGWIDKSGHWAITEVNGQRLLDSEDLRDWRYSEGLVPFPVHSENKYLWGYMNQRGEVVIKPKGVRWVGPFVGGVAHVFFNENLDYSAEGRGGFFDKESKQFIEGKDGYINRTGQFIWPPK
ncbi:MAG: WG repeat-containing protein [Pyrinomonadaceae bacterium]